MGLRESNIQSADQQQFDVAIIGGGINGACLYDRLIREGHRVVLIEKGDFSSGTSQASAMMVWGGLLYLGNLDFKAVNDFSTSREKMIEKMPDWVKPRSFRFLPASRGKLSTLPVGLALYLYWMFSRLKRRKPKLERQFSQKHQMTHTGNSFLFEEGQLTQSDARFVLHWITKHRTSQSTALNYCSLESGNYDKENCCWQLHVKDQLRGTPLKLEAKAIVNCAGIWTDSINDKFGIRSPFKHVLSKGVFLGLRRHLNQDDPLIMDMGEHNDVINSIPWGPITLWGPTETPISNIEEGRNASTKDIDFLIEKYNRSHKKKLDKDNIVSIRCGVRPLAVKKSYESNEYPLEISRRYRIVVDQKFPWISVYGSKLTGCEQLASSVAKHIRPFFPSKRPTHKKIQGEQIPCSESFSFPGIESSFPPISWCREYEYCCTLEDYLRRRTNIAQWVEREGYGKNNEHESVIRSLCLELHNGDEAAAEAELLKYRSSVEQGFDQILEAVETE